MAAGDAPRFVDASLLDPGEAYECHIARTGTVPTRDNLHDLLNGLVWLRHGRLKRRLNALHVAAIGRDGAGARRGALRDALTLFDECGAVWREPDAVLLEALRAHDWRGLFVRDRARWAGQHVEIVGHGLLEQLATAPRKALTAHVLAGLDPLALTEAQWAAKPFLPLPVLGIPGWWPGQESPDFYDDPKVFRPARPLKSGPAP